MKSFYRHLQTVLLALTLTASAVAADAPPAGAEARTITKVTATIAREKVSALLDVNDAPEFKEWGLKAAGYALKFYPEICRQLASEGFTPAREFTLRIKPDKGVAATTGTVITINADYIKKHPEDLGMVAHELVHVIQHYQGGKNPGWLVEGIADYLRYYVIEPDSKNGQFDAEKATYMQGYQPAAALLHWLELKKGPGLISKLNAAMRDKKFTEATFKEMTGLEPDAAWAEFKTSLAKK